MSSSENQNVCYPETSNLPLQSTSPQTAAQIQYRQVPYTPQRLTPQSEYQIPSQRSQHKKPAHTITLKIWQFVLCLLGAAAASPLLIIVIAGFVIMIQGYTGAVSSPTGTIGKIASECDVPVNEGGEIVYQFRTMGAQDQFDKGICVLDKYPGGEPDYATNTSGSLEKNGVVYEWSVLVNDGNSLGTDYMATLYIHEE
jgi:hypothetical protein